MLGRLAFWRHREPDVGDEARAHRAVTARAVAAALKAAERAEETAIRQDALTDSYRAMLRPTGNFVRDRIAGVEPTEGGG
jgi:hypothetical protein